MDQIKIGEFLKELRKEGLFQGGKQVIICLI